MRALRPGTDAQVGVLIDAFAAFAMNDGGLNTTEADLILDLLRSAFPEVDHSWLSKRLQRSVKHPRPLQNLAAELKEMYDDQGKVALGLQLYALVNATDQPELNRSSFKVFMRRLGKPELGSSILREMNLNGRPCKDKLPFERLLFGGRHRDVELPPAAADHEFRLYRTGDLLLIRNTGSHSLWIRGRSVETGAFIRIRERQELILPGWSLSYLDLLFFLNASHSGHVPTLYLSENEDGLVADRTMARQSMAKVSFGVEATIETLKDSSLQLSSWGALKAGERIECSHHDRIGNISGFSFSINDLRLKAMQSGRRFRISSDRQEYLVSNDPSALANEGLLLGPQLSPRTVLFIRYDNQAEKGTLEIRDANGPILVDGSPARGKAKLREGSLIRISGNQATRCRFAEGFLDEERTLIEQLRVEDLVHDFGRQARALDQVGFEVKRGEMMCIIGPSGSGKSTLLSVLSGQKRPTRGKVTLNDFSIYEKRDELTPFIASMPQEEALNPQLTVREHLRHAVTIRRPALSLAEHERRVDSMLAEMGLLRIADRQVGSPGEKTISGGERSRLNLALDLGSRAEVFLFDEPISGLSSKDAEHVASTLRSLARDKIVVASLHRPGSQVLRLFDLVLLLDSGGRVAYFGSPTGMVGYFREACRELGIYHPEVDSHNPLGADFVFDVLETPFSSLVATGDNPMARRFPSTFWQERFESADLMRIIRADPAPASRLHEPAGRERPPIPPKPQRRVRAPLSVFATHFLRSFLSKIRNKGTIYSTLLEAPLLAAMISITLRSSPKGSYDFSTALHIPAYLFLSATVAMFLGLTNSASEVLRDRAMLRRERNVNPGASAYVTAKFCALSIVAGAQCFTYLIVGNHFLEIEGMLIYHWAWMTLTALSGTALALLVSSVVRSERSALTCVPLLLVPQMLFAGALVMYKEMNHGLFDNTKEIRERGGVPVPATIMPLRYAYEGLVLSQATRNPFEVERNRLQRRIDQVKILDKEMSEKDIKRFELAKSGLRRLLAAGATNKAEAHELVKRIRSVAAGGDMFAMEMMEVWPEDKKAARPASDFFVNERIDLLVREAETFRTDYRNKKNRIVFYSLKKPLPWAPDADPEEILNQPDASTVKTQYYCASVLVLFIAACTGLAILTITRQNRKTR